jgi:diaminobutyrate acetyltransferase
MSGKHLIEYPTKADGAALWRIARDSDKLDLNSPYAYLLWCHDFADSTVVAKVDGQAVGFVIAYRKPGAPDTALVWQVAVDASQRGKGLAGALLDELFTKLVDRGVQYLRPPSHLTTRHPSACSARSPSGGTRSWKARSCSVPMTFRTTVRTRTSPRISIALGR